MEGWDGTDDGAASDLTRRRWQRFGQSGAALIWGGEAVAVRQDGRANPQQLLLTPENASSIGGLLTTLRDAHAERFGRASADALLVGLQLTHSGRFATTSARPRARPARRLRASAARQRDSPAAFAC